MPRVNWGIDSGVIDEFDRDSQFKPYSGPIPPNGVYQFRINVLKAVAGAKDKYPQLRPGLALVPRRDRPEERSYKDYFIMTFLPISENAAFRYAPFCDAIGVSGKDFTSRTIVDEEGNVRKIGGWVNRGDTVILAQLQDGQDQNGNPRKEIGWLGPLDEDGPDEETDVDENETDDPF